jgi:transcription initiation factor TFIIIB Brf1 subunit/transcription initiation factor TFIIB
MARMYINEIESQIQSLKETIASIFKFFAEREGFPSSMVDELAHDAMNIFLELYRKKRHIGRSFESLAQNSILLAARKRGIPIKNYKAVFSMLKNLDQNISSYSPLPYIEWLCHNLRLSRTIEEKAKEIANAFRTKTYKRPSPRVLAASSVYVACLINGERKTQKEIARIAKCTDVSIRNVYHDIIRELQISLDNSNTRLNGEKKISIPANSGITNKKIENSNVSKDQKDILTVIKSMIPEFEYLTLKQQIIEIHKLFPKLKPKGIAKILGTTPQTVRNRLCEYRKSLL